MSLFSRDRIAFFNRFLSKLPGFSSKDRYSLTFLNCTQFLGVINDNIFKLVLVFLLIETLGHKEASSILSSVGAIYVAPFLLFSSAAGVLADRFSKQRLLIAMKVVEVIIMALAIVAFSYKSRGGGYLLLFLLSTHSATFGPSKYGIIPELVSSEKVSRANGLITSFTYLGVIVGTFLASFLTEITHHHFILVAAFCVLLALLGLICSFGIKRTPSQGSTKKINIFFFQEIFQNLAFCRTKKHLFTAILGSSYFLFIGAYTQLNVIPYAIECLHQSDIIGGYLFLCTALGIALGSILAGKASKKQVELGLSCLAMLATALLFICLSIFSSNLTAVIILLFFLGVFGGMLIVPFDSFIQLKSPNEKRGQIIASANFLSFSGVLLASFALYFFSQPLGLSPAGGFAALGLITGAATLFFLSRLSDLVFSYTGRRLIRPFIRPLFKGNEIVEQAIRPVLILEHASWKKALLLQSAFPNIHFFLTAPHWISSLAYSVHTLPNGSIEKLLETVSAFSSEEIIPCLYLKKGASPKEIPASSFFKDLFKASPQLILVTMKDKTITFKKF